jgi:predicted PurR-regulated permease PerM
LRNRTGEQPRSPIATGVLIALAVIGVVLALWLLRALQAVIVLILIALVFVAGIDPLVDRIQSLKLPRGRRIPRALAIIIVLLAAILGVLGIIFYIGSVAWAEGRILVEQFPTYTAGLQEWLIGLSNQYPQIPPMEDLLEQLRQQIGQIGQYALQTTAAVFGVLGGILSSVIVLFLIFYISLEKQGITNTFFSFIPPKHHPPVRRALSEAGSKMGGWLRGQLILGGIVLVVISATMALLGMPYPLLLGLIGGIAEVVPLLGPSVAAIVAVPIALATKPLWVVIVVIAFFVVFTQLEGNWLVPRVMQSQVDLTPLTTIVALLVGASLLGVVGALLAVPVAAAIRVLVIRLVVPAIQKSGHPEGQQEIPESTERFE